MVSKGAVTEAGIYITSTKHRILETGAGMRGRREAVQIRLVLSTATCWEKGFAPSNELSPLAQWTNRQPSRRVGLKEYAPC